MNITTEFQTLEAKSLGPLDRREALNGARHHLACGMKPGMPAFTTSLNLLSTLNPIDFIKRVFRKGGDVEILPRASRSRGSGK